MKLPFLYFAGWLLLLSVVLKADDANLFDLENLSAEVETVEGVSGQQAIVSLEGGANIPLKGPFPLEAGSLSLWISPQNWDGSEEDFVELLKASAPDTAWRLYKYKKDNNHYGLSLLYGTGMAERSQFAFATVPISEWKRKEWHHIVAVWDQKGRMLELYLNGEKKSAVGLAASHFATGEVSSVDLAAGPHRSALSHLHLHPRPLGEEEIVKLYREGTPPVAEELTQVPRATLTIPKVRRAPVIDGKFDLGEWDHAAKVVGGLWMGSPRITKESFFSTSVCYDEERLYFLIASPAPSMRLKAETKEHGNAKIASDDAVEFFFSPRNNGYYQLVGNSLGFLYANHSGNTAWKGDWKFANTLFEGVWYAELSIPFAALGEKTPQKGDRWAANFCRDWALPDVTLFTSWSYSRGPYFSNLGEMIFGGEGAYTQLDVDPDELAAGRIRGTVALAGDASSTDTAKVVISLVDGSGTLSTQEKELRREGASPAILPVEIDLPSGRTASVGVEVALTDGERLSHQSLPARVEGDANVSILPRLQEQELAVEITLASELEGELTLQIGDARTGLQEKWFKAKGEARQELRLSSANLPAGYYDVSLKNGEHPLYEGKYDHPGDAPWLTYQSDESKIPKPWTPIRYQENEVTFWGRSYRIGAQPFPEAMTALGVQLNRAPITLLLEADGQPLQWKQKVDWKEQSGNAAAYHLHAETPKWKATAAVRFEFDGLWWVELDLEPKTPDATLNRIALNLPMAKGVASLVYAHNYIGNTVQGDLKENSLGHYLANVWIGNDKVGLTWFAESDQYWSRTKEDQAITYTPDEQGGVFAVAPVRADFTPGKAVRYAFGLQATPVRPLDPNRRALRLQPGIRANLAHPWNLDRSVKKYAATDKEWGFLSPHETSIPALRKELAQWRERGMEMPWYIAPDIISPQATEYRMMREQWRNPHGTYPFACVNSSYAQFLNWSMDRLIREGGLRAIYVDCAKAYPCGNEAHGCGYRDEAGVLRLTTPVLALRRHFRHLYTSLHESEAHGDLPKALILHTFSGVTSAACGFSDMILEGEEVQYRIVNTPSYLDLYPSDQWRAIFSHAFGYNMALLPNYGRVGPASQRASEALSATFMVHALLNDTPLWNLWTHEGYVNRVLDALDGAGVTSAQTRFVPWWEQQEVKASHPAVKTSLYYTPQGLMLVVANDTKEALQTTIGMSDKVEMEDLLSRERMVANETNLTVPAENFRLLMIEKEKDHP